MAFDEIRADEYASAPDAAQLGLLLINTVDEHKHLADATVGYIFRDDEVRRQGKVLAAECILTERLAPSSKRDARLLKWAYCQLLGTTTPPDFIVLIDRNIWSGYDADEKLALIDHELSHAFYVTEDDGETAKLTREGEYQWAIKGHDVEEFCGVVARRGLWNEELREMARVIVNGLAARAEAV